MATSAAPPEVERDGTNPIVIVLGTVLTVVLVTFLIYRVGDNPAQDALRAGGTTNRAGPAPLGACGQGTEADGSYSVDLVATPSPPRPEGTSFVLTLRREGRAVTGAKVCLMADMPEMEHPGINYLAKESSGGRYEARLVFGMGGTWRAAVTIAEPEKPVVSVPLKIEVAQVDPA